MADQSIDVLRRAAASGGPLELTRLAERLMGGSTPQELSEAGAALDQAIRAGGVEAPRMLAVLYAIGVCRPHDWDRALDLLQIAAERGSPSAQGQLAALAGADAQDAQSPTPGHWRGLRASIDPGDWERPGRQEILVRSPRIYRYAPFVSPAVCAWIIGRAQGRIERARVYDPDSLGSRVEGVRSNGAFAFNFPDLDVVLAMLRFRVAAYVGVGPGALEPPQVLHYRVGEQFEPHYDFLDPALPGHVGELAERGQRTTTCLVYLNAEFEGGETDFPLLGLSHKPPAGDGLCFSNVQPSGEPDRRTLHAGLAPIRGEKWILSQWIRGRPGG